MTACQIWVRGQTQVNINWPPSNKWHWHAPAQPGEYVKESLVAILNMATTRVSPIIYWSYLRCSDFHVATV